MTTTTTPEQIAAILNGREYRCELDGPPDVIELAEAAGLVIVFGASDDLIEIRGAVDDEGDYPETVRVDAQGIVKRNEEMSDEEFAEYLRRKDGAVELTAHWDTDTGYSWTYTTDQPHATFDIMEDGEKYCRGIVFRLPDAAATPAAFYPYPQTYDAEGNPRTKRLALDPDLTDGEHWTIHDEPNEVLLDLIRAWMAEAVDGDEVTLKLRTMSAAEAGALPEI